MLESTVRDNTERTLPGTICMPVRPLNFHNRWDSLYAGQATKRDNLCAPQTNKFHFKSKQCNDAGLEASGFVVRSYEGVMLHYTMSASLILAVH